MLCEKVGIRDGFHVTVEKETIGTTPVGYVVIIQTYEGGSRLGGPLMSVDEIRKVRDALNKFLEDSP